MNTSALIEVAELQQVINRADLRVVDARYVLSQPEAGRELWTRSHIPGAQFVDLDSDLSDHQKSSGLGRHPLPDAGKFCAVLQRIGISTDSHVVVYDAADGAMAAARFWWMLRLLDHERIQVLNGGLAAWVAAGAALSSEAQPVARGNYQARFDSSQMIWTGPLRDALGQRSVQVIDARAAERFRGDVEPLDKKAGHIPSALNRPLATNLIDGRFKPAEQLRSEFQALLGSHASNEVVHSCGSGVTACHNLLAMEVAGLHGARIYPPSWSGWISDPENPIALGD